MLDINVTTKLAELSKLSFSEQELLQISQELGDIIAFTDTVGDFNGQPGNNNQDNAVKYSELREDISKESLPREQILKNAKESSESYFKVPKVV